MSCPTAGGGTGGRRESRLRDACEADEHVMAGRRGAVDKIPEEQCVIAGANIRVLRQRRGWTQAKIGELMGWPSASTVCAAQGRRDGRQRGFTTQEIRQLAALLGVC